MSLADLSVRRPITIFMVTVAVATFGYMAVSRLPVELLPDLSYPTLTVQTVYEDAAPLSVEQFVTQPVQQRGRDDLPGIHCRPSRRHKRGKNLVTVAPASGELADEFRLTEQPAGPVEISRHEIVGFDRVGLKIIDVVCCTNMLCLTIMMRFEVSLQLL